MTPPTTTAPPRPSWLSACAASACGVSSARIRSSVAPARWQTSMASATASTGGVSTSTRSKRDSASASISRRRGWLSSSEGLEGSVPAPNSHRSDTAVRRAASRRLTLPASTSARPRPPSMPKWPTSAPRRRSASTSSTRRPASAATTARLAAVKVLPSPARALVSATMRRPPGARPSCKAARSMRSPSTASASGCWRASRYWSWPAQPASLIPPCTLATTAPSPAASSTVLPGARARCPSWRCSLLNITSQITGSASPASTVPAEASCAARRSRSMAPASASSSPAAPAAAVSSARGGPAGTTDGVAASSSSASPPASARASASRCAWLRSHM
ncbi:hypothetical protein D9M68_142890 [compost metagenome]